VTNRLWLTVPQAVVLEVTRNLDLALSLTEDDPNLVVIIANRLTARPRVIPLEADSDEDEKLEARRQLHKDKDALKDTSRYTQGQQRVHQRLIAGLTAQASRIPGGPYEVVDPVEFTSVELIGVDAVSKRTGSVSLYDLRINGVEYIENLTGKPIEAEKWAHTGDPVPKLIRWARSKWGDDKLPNRAQLLQVFREQFGPIRGVNEHTMREVRRQLAPERARRGGAPMHRRQPGK
jgi:hypothetical protein